MEYLKRKDWLYNPSVLLTSIALNLVNDISIIGAKHFESVKTRSFVLLPNHKKEGEDILSAGYVLARTLHRPAYYPAKSSLAKSDNEFKEQLKKFIYESQGAIFFSRDKEVRATTTKKTPEERHQRIKMLDYVRKTNETGYKAVASALDKGEIVVLYPEGKTVPEPTFKPNKSILRSLTSLATIEDPYFVPMQIQYETVSKKIFLWPRDKEIITIGLPIQTRNANELEDHLLKYIRH